MLLNVFIWSRLVDKLVKVVNLTEIIRWAGGDSSHGQVLDQTQVTQLSIARLSETVYANEARAASRHEMNMMAHHQLMGWAGQVGGYFQIPPHQPQFPRPAFGSSFHNMSSLDYPRPHFHNEVHDRHLLLRTRPRFVSILPAPPNEPDVTTNQLSITTIDSHVTHDPPLTPVRSQQPANDAEKKRE